MVTQLNKLAQEYRDVFAVKSNELGRTNLFMHKINTENHAPISQSPYQQSEQKRNITKQMVNELLQDGIITNSFSPWCSPVVLVSKKTGDWRYLSKIECDNGKRFISITKYQYIS